MGLFHALRHLCRDWWLGVGSLGVLGMGRSDREPVIDSSFNLGRNIEHLGEFVDVVEEVTELVICNSIAGCLLMRVHRKCAYYNRDNMK